MNPHLNLGYGSENARLREERDIRCSRFCWLRTLKARGGRHRARLLALQNLHGLGVTLLWNAAHDIRLFRMSSNLFPRAAHPEADYTLDFAQEMLATVGKIARKHGIRLTLHPSMHHILSSPKEKVTTLAQRGLAHQCEVLERMGMDRQSVVVIHVGGVQGNKAAALRRLEANLLALEPRVRDRLVLENDEHSYTVQDLLPISHRLRIPIVVDFHHDAIHPGSRPVTDYLPDVFQVWDWRGIKPKVHVSQSEQGVGRKASKKSRCKHGPHIDQLPPALLNATRDIDVMFETSKAETAVLLFRARAKAAAAAGHGPAPQPSLPARQAGSRKRKR